MTNMLRTSAGRRLRTLPLAAVPALAACEVAEDNPAGSPPWSVGAEPVSVYGSAGDDPDTGLGYVADVVRGPDGTIAAADGRLFVFDRGLQRLSEWTFGGAYAGGTRLTRQATYRPIGEVGLFEDGGWYAREEDAARRPAVPGCG